MAVPAAVPVAPRLPADLTDAGGIVLGTDQRWESLRIRADFAGQVAEDLEVNGCLVTGSTFTGAELVRARVSDSVFERCDLSAAVLDHAALTRVEFDDCRLSGADLSAARLVDVVFRECRLVDISLRMASGHRVRFDHCDLGGADLYASQLPGARFFDSNLTGAELSQAKLTEARLHGSRFDSLRGAAALRGTTISSAQIVPVALQLLAVLEITVDDEREPPSR
jgi:fluoroquinolone resistance protein